MDSQGRTPLDEAQSAGQAEVEALLLSGLGAGSSAAGAGGTLSTRPPAAVGCLPGEAARGQRPWLLAPPAPRGGPQLRRPAVLRPLRVYRPPGRVAGAARLQCLRSEARMAAGHAQRSAWLL